MCAKKAVGELSSTSKAGVCVHRGKTSKNLPGDFLEAGVTMTPVKKRKVKVQTETIIDLLGKACRDSTRWSDRHRRLVPFLVLLIFTTLCITTGARKHIHVFYITTSQAHDAA